MESDTKSLAIVLDPLDYDPQRYMEMLTNISFEHGFYKGIGGAIDGPDREFLVKTKWPSFQQPLGSILCGYYICEMLRVNERFITDYDNEYCNDIGRFFNDEGVLPEDKYKPLAWWVQDNN
uniref:Uncharacterized protein n=1 Tax=Oryza brachyantha TaxID=4533 RepID=J3NC80_ORYBR